jgi:hypothetical protein
VIEQDNRLALWRAFSEFFLDTEPTENSFLLAAKAILEADVSIEVARSVLWNEVFPALHHNFLDPAGVWAGWPDEWLVKNIKPALGSVQCSGPPGVTSEIERCWQRTLGHLPVTGAQR